MVQDHDTPDRALVPGADDEAADRVLPLVGIHNFRDYGGYRAANGRLRRGLLWRSAQHRDATPDDLARVGALNLVTVVDLRGASERAAAPCPRPQGFAARVVKVDSETAGLAPHMEAARDLGDPVQARAAMDAGYAGMPFRPVLAQVLRGYFAALAGGEGSSLIHCMAGKDRTGLAVALVHAMLGVHRDDVLADYLLTNTAGNVEERIAAGATTVRRAYGDGLSDASLRVLLTVEPSYLQSAFAAIDDRHGSLDRYLSDVLGVDDARRTRIEAQLVA